MAKAKKVVEAIKEAVAPKPVVETSSFKCDNCEDSGRVCYQCSPLG